LSYEAERALTDFAYFRLRYFGRKSTPWQVYAANLVMGALAEAQVTMERKFFVINVPPSSGKSTLFTHDLVCWLVCRDRSVRVLIGSANETLATAYTEQVLTTFERSIPAPLEAAQARRGAVQALAALAEDYGVFKSDNGRNWRGRAFKVLQPDDQATTSKEATVAAFGRDSGYLGQRPDVSIWDDLVTEETSGSSMARERTLRKWQREAEQRVEPGGVLVLQGQRLFADDLYRYAIDLPAEDDDVDGKEDAKKYVHIVFKAHYEEHCKGDHEYTAMPYDPAKPEDSGCLLDPVGLSWKFLRQIMRDDEVSGTSTYNIVFQQGDGTSGTTLVDELWINGGEDPLTGEQFFGCWDTDRNAGEVPELEGAAFSVLSVDSSPTQFWANGWWVYEPATERRYLIDLRRAKMKVSDAIAYDKDTRTYSGLFEDWWQTSVEQKHPIKWLIFEAVAAERYFLDSNDLKDWANLRGVQVIRHDTHKNKQDPKYGVQSLGPLYRQGKIRLPGHIVSGSRVRIMPLVREVTRYPDSNTEDAIMMQWFLEMNLGNLVAAQQGPIRRQVPGYIKSNRRVFA